MLARTGARIVVSHSLKDIAPVRRVRDALRVRHCFRVCVDVGSVGEDAGVAEALDGLPAKRRPSTNPGLAIRPCRPHSSNVGPAEGIGPIRPRVHPTGAST